LPGAVRPITLEKAEQSLRAGPDRVPAVFLTGERVAFAGQLLERMLSEMDVDVFGVAEATRSPRKEAKRQ